MSLFGFGGRHTGLKNQFEELNYVSFEELLSTNNTYVEVINNKEVILLESVVVGALFILCGMFSGFFRGVQWRF